MRDMRRRVLVLLLIAAPGCTAGPTAPEGMSAHVTVAVPQARRAAAGEWLRQVNASIKSGMRLDQADLSLVTIETFRAPLPSELLPGPEPSRWKYWNPKYPDLLLQTEWDNTG